MANDFPIPKPGLEHDFRITVDLNSRISVGAGVWGQRNWISFTGGTWEASWGKGIVEPGGQDSQLVLEDGSCKIATNYLLKTDDGGYIVINTSGWRTGDPEVLKALSNPDTADSVDPATYKFRLYLSLETGHPKYSFLNTGMWVGSGIRKGAQVLYDAYRIT